MHRYHVEAISDQGRAIALRDCTGKYHLARATAEVPTVGAALDGALPGLGFGVLVAPDTRRFFRVMFELVGCDRLATLEREQTRLTP